MAKELPIGVAQKKVIELLGSETATELWSGAEAYFERKGIRVRAVRVGRTSEPRVRLRNPDGGGFTREGDGDSWGAIHDLTTEQLAALQAAGWWEE
jgi:hypothetical protein